MNIKTIVWDAVREAQDRPITKSGDEKGPLHRERSENFIRCLSERLKNECNSNPKEVASLFRYDDTYRSKFGMNELLFDIAVLEYETVSSGTSGKELFFVTRGLWIVESEMANNKRQALFDFNKLVIGDAENKLFIGPRLSDEQDYLRVLGMAANHCSGKIFVALIPHPRDWPVKGVDSVVAWKRDNSSWISVA